MTIFVEFGLLQGSTINPAYLLIGHPTQGLIGTGQIAPTDVLVEYGSTRIMSLSVERSSTRRVGPVIEYNAGTATVVLLNKDGALDPYTIEQAGLTAPGVVMRIVDVYNGVTYPVWRGFVDSWLPSHVYPTHATVTVTGVDGFSRLAGYQRTAGSPVGGGENTGARLNRILDSVGWPATDRSIATGDSTLQATTLDGDALDEAQQAVLNEVGEFYVNASGVMYFRNRRALLTDTRSTTSQATFGSDIAGGELPYVDTPGLSYDRTQLVNRVEATRTGGVTQVVEDGNSIGRYGYYPHEETLLLQTDADAAGWAGYVLQQDLIPEFRFTSLTIDGRVLPNLMMPQALSREIGDRITVTRRPPGGIVDARDVFIRSIQHTWAPPDKWLTTWGLQPADRFSFFVIGHPSMGVIGQNALAF